MDSDIIIKFVKYFQDFVILCQSEQWPSDSIDQTEIKNALKIAKHIENCLDELQKRGLLNDFLSCLNRDEAVSSLIRKCCSGPPKHILKKIICSKLHVDKVNSAFNIFIEVFGENRLEDCLTDMMTEAASVDILLKNITIEIPQGSILKVRNDLFLYLISAINTSDILVYLETCDENMLELLFTCLIGVNVQNDVIKDRIKKILITAMSSKDLKYKGFWKKIFNIDSTYLIEVCIIHDDICKLIMKALMDSCKILQENMSGEFFYIELSHSELAKAVQKLLVNKICSTILVCEVMENNINPQFWSTLIKK